MIKGAKSWEEGEKGRKRGKGEGEKWSEKAKTRGIFLGKRWEEGNVENECDDSKHEHT